MICLHNNITVKNIKLSFPSDRAVIFLSSSGMNMTQRTAQALGNLETWLCLSSRSLPRLDPIVLSYQPSFSL
jgi:hypothetical protein